MSRTMLINAARREETRVAIVEGTELIDYHVEVADRTLTRGNIYRGVIANIQPSLNAAFIDYGEARHGFLAIQDVVPEAWYGKPASPNKPRIEEVLQKGQPVVVQVTREAEAAKGAVVTTNLSLAGRYLVLTPFESTRGISRKVEDDATRSSLRAKVKELKVPEGCGVIVRTNALDQTKTSLARDLAALQRLWKGIETGAREGRGTKLLYSDQDPILRSLRDHLDAAVTEIVVDSEAAHQLAEQYLKAFMPRTKVELILWKERAPLFSRHRVDGAIDQIYERTVPLPGRGSISIDRTEALTAIDVNSGKSTGASRQEDTALATNLEAAAEIALQLRLRDLGGLVVVDFIDMKTSRHRLKVEKAMKDAMKPDRARFSVGRISPNGLLEINRQKISQAIEQRTHVQCPTCSGNGRIPSPETLGFGLMRRIEERVAAGSVRKVRLGLHPDQANAFQNRFRRELARIEEELAVEIEIYGASRLHITDTEVEFLHREAGALSPVPEPPRALGIVAQVVSTPIALTPSQRPASQHQGARSESSRSEAQRSDGRRSARPARGSGRGAQGVGAKPMGDTAAGIPDPWASASGGFDGGSGLATGEAKPAGENGSGEETGSRRRRRRRGGRNRRRRGDGFAGANGESGPNEGSANGETNSGSEDNSTAEANFNGEASTNREPSVNSEPRRVADAGVSSEPAGADEPSFEQADSD